MSARAEELIGLLGLAPHPEGGWYRETFRSTIEVDPLDGRSRRSALTGIYFLLTHGQRSRWHRVASDEIWTHLEGAPVRLLTFDPANGKLETTLLGPFALDERSSRWASSPAAPASSVPASTSRTSSCSTPTPKRAPRSSGSMGSC
jgi:predicted cupin superfamily sugar epimerase